MKKLTVRRLRGRDTVYVSGWGARDLIVDCLGRPQWSNQQSAWMTNVRVGSDVVAVAEEMGYEVTFVEVGDAR